MHNNPPFVIRLACFGLFGLFFACVTGGVLAKEPVAALWPGMCLLLDCVALAVHCPLIKPKAGS